jgi:hypothetical protein
MTGSSHLWSLVAAILLASTTSSAAEPSAADRETARALMAEGRARREQGDLRAALGAFAAADALMHAPTTSLELARTHEALGEIVEASDIALRVIRAPDLADDPPPYRLAHRAAEKLYDELQTRIPSLKISVTTVSDEATPSMTIDGVRVVPELLGHARKLNPGRHVIAVSQGSFAGKQAIDIDERDFKEITVELLPIAQPSGESGSGSQNRLKTGSHRSAANRAMIYGGLGVAGAGLAVGTTAAVLSISKTHNIRRSGACDGNQCGPSEFDDIESARLTAAIATVGFIGAGAGAVVGVIGLLMAADSKTAPVGRDAPRLQTWVGLGEVGLRGQF